MLPRDKRHKQLEDQGFFTRRMIGNHNHNYLKPIIQQLYIIF